MIGAIENPHVTAISHPTGRLINRRQSYEVDLEAVFDAAVKHGKFMELNSNPRRLDLDDVNCAAAKRHGIPIVISTDAHSIGNLAMMRYGILQARRAGLTKEDVVNTRPWEEVRRHDRQSAAASLTTVGVQRRLMAFIHISLEAPHLIISAAHAR